MLQGLGKGLLTLALFSALIVDTDAATTRYVTENGSGTACTDVEPCAIDVGVNDAAAGDTVSIGAGSYDGTLEATGVQVIGPPDAFAGLEGQLTLIGGGVRDLAVYSGTAVPLTLSDGAVAERVRVDQYGENGTGTPADACAVASATIADSLCTARPDETHAAVSTSGTATLRGITAVGSGAGLRVTGGTTTVRNSILYGGDLADIETPGGAATLTNSNYDTVSDPTDITSTGQQTDTPDFASPDDGDYSQAPGSPTIDAGDDTFVQSGELDIDSNLRKLGAHVDIGADEVVPGVPSVTLGATTDVTTRQALLAFTLDSAGGAGYVTVNVGPPGT